MDNLDIMDETENLPIPPTPTAKAAESRPKRLRKVPTRMQNSEFEYGFVSLAKKGKLSENTNLMPVKIPLIQTEHTQHLEQLMGQKSDSLSTEQSGFDDRMGIDVREDIKVVFGSTAQQQKISHLRPSFIEGKQEEQKEKDAKVPPSIAQFVVCDSSNQKFEAVASSDEGNYPLGGHSLSPLILQPNVDQRNSFPKMVRELGYAKPKWKPPRKVWATTNLDFPFSSPVECQVCAKSFLSLPDLRKHRRSQSHQTQVEQLQSKNDDAPNADTSNGELNLVEIEVEERVYFHSHISEAYFKVITILSPETEEVTTNLKMIFKDLENKIFKLATPTSTRPTSLAANASFRGEADGVKSTKSPELKSISILSPETEEVTTNLKKVFEDFENKNLLQGPPTSTAPIASFRIEADGVKKKRKSSGPKSVVWKHFVKQENNTVLCITCSQVIKSEKGSTSEMIQHLKSKHPKINLVLTPITSFAWNHFEKQEDNKAMCKFCGVIIKTSGGTTSTMIRHLKSQHQEFDDDALQEAMELRQKDKTIQSLTEEIQRLNQALLQQRITPAHPGSHSGHGLGVCSVKQHGLFKRSEFMTEP